MDLTKCLQDVFILETNQDRKYQQSCMGIMPKHKFRGLPTIQFVTSAVVLHSKDGFSSVIELQKNLGTTISEKQNEMRECSTFSLYKTQDDERQFHKYRKAKSKTEMTMVEEKSVSDLRSEAFNIDNSSSFEIKKIQKFSQKYAFISKR